MNQFQFQQQQNQIQQNMQIGSGLTRYRSAPSSYFDSFLNGDDDLEHLLNHRVCSPETQRIFARFMSGGDAVQENCAAPNAPQSQIPPPRKDGGDEPEVKRPRQQLQRQQSRDFSSISPANCDVKSLLGGPVEANRGVAQVKTESHSLVRHSSSPAGLFDSINIEEFGAMRGIGNSGAGNIANAEGSFSSASRCKSSQMDLPPRTPSSSAKMGPVSGLGNKGIRDNRPLDGQFNEYRSNDVPNFPSNQWDDSILSDDFFKGLGEDDIKPFPKATALDDQKNDGGNRTSTRLSHHLSLPKSCAAMENLLEDSVPCKLRAKRGFATHPRSIAERVRRTKISERIRKLQELVPNMDKQTNTADMLDLAIDYIKDLQRQVKTLSDNGAKCGCCAKEKS